MKQIVGYNDEIIDLTFLPSPALINGNPPSQLKANKIAMTQLIVINYEYLI